jgi:hypothetical protein
VNAPPPRRSGKSASRGGGGGGIAPDSDGDAAFASGGDGGRGHMEGEEEITDHSLGLDRGLPWNEHFHIQPSLVGDGHGGAVCWHWRDKCGHLSILRSMRQRLKWQGIDVP